MEITLEFPNLSWLVGNSFGQNGQNLHENVKFSVFCAKYSRGGGRQPKYCRKRSKILGWWGDSLYYPLRGNNIHHTSFQAKE